MVYRYGDEMQGVEVLLSLRNANKKKVTSLTIPIDEDSVTQSREVITSGGDKTTDHNLLPPSLRHLLRGRREAYRKEELACPPSSTIISIPSLLIFPLDLLKKDWGGAEGKTPDIYS